MSPLASPHLRTQYPICFEDMKPYIDMDMNLDMIMLMSDSPKIAKLMDSSKTRACEWEEIDGSFVGNEVGQSEAKL